MGEAVNLDFLILEWTETVAKSGGWAAGSVASGLDQSVKLGEPCIVNFKGIEKPVLVYELCN